MSPVSHPEVLTAPTEPYSPGDSIENPVTGERGTLIKGPWEGDDTSLLVELHVQPIAVARGYRGTYPQYGRSLLRTSAR